MRKLLLLLALGFAFTAGACSSGPQNGSSDTGKHTVNAPSANADTAHKVESAASQSVPENK